MHLGKLWCWHSSRGSNICSSHHIYPLQKRVRAVYRRLGLPTRTTYDKEKVLAEMLHDKKAQGGQITVIKVPGLGCWRAETIPVEGLRPLLGMEE